MDLIGAANTANTANLPSSAAKYPDGNYIAMDIGMARRHDFAGFDDDGFLESFRMEPQTEFHDIVLDCRARRGCPQFRREASGCPRKRPRPL